jgi:pyruvate kinase
MQTCSVTRMRNTKIVATLGPASTAPDIIRGLLDAGVDVFRLNLSHGVHEEHGARIETVRRIAAESGRQVGILLDLQGPKIRLGNFENGGCVLHAGGIFTITTEEVLGNEHIASTSYVNFAKDVKPGARVLLADGSVELRVLDTDGVRVRCEVVTGGPIADRKGINLPGVEVSTPSLTRKDMADIEFGLRSGIDMVALSFVRRRDDMLRLRLFLENLDADIPMIAKIEKPEGWENLDAILEEADGVMVARGDLGVEMALEKVPFIQKSIIERARERGRFVITATQMLESMMENPWPTRAEVSDVANAIYDGTDAVMLSGETSAGKYPVEAARMMARIACEAEASLSGHKRFDSHHPNSLDPAEIIAAAAHGAAFTLNAAAIVVFTSSGSSAKLVSRYRPHVPIYAFTPSEALARQLAPHYGVHAIRAPGETSTDEVLSAIDRLLVERCRLSRGDRIVFVAGQPIGAAHTTNMLLLRQVG